MKRGSFEPKRFDQPVEEIVPQQTPDLDINRARDECSEAVAKLSADVDGIGPKAAERYLLRFEFGVSTDTLTEHYGIAKSTLSNQVNQVHRTILRYPSLARVRGQFRANRAGLSRPASTDRTLWEDELNLHSQQVFVTVDFQPGDFSTPYSWLVDLRADLMLDERSRRLRCNYFIDEEYGVLLKRILRGVSTEAKERTYRYERLRTIEIYPLPHPSFQTTDGTLLDALQYHVSYDITRGFEDAAWNSIEKRIQFGVHNSGFRPRPEHALPESMSGEQSTRERLERYTKEVHRRDNLEHVLRLYPLTRIENIPRETVDQIWNGTLTDEYLDTILRTSEPQYNPGSHRSIWALS